MSGSSFNLTLRVFLAHSSDDPSEPLSCPGCGANLTLHQPEEDAPHRLLMSCSCEEDGAWYAAVPAAERDKVYLIRIPPSEEMQAALAGNIGSSPGRVSASRRNGRIPQC